MSNDEKVTHIWNLLNQDSYKRFEFMKHNLNTQMSDMKKKMHELKIKVKKKYGKDLEKDLKKNIELGLCIDLEKQLEIYESEYKLNLKK